ncbi:MAG: S-layer homology domain-containing protein [Oscillospiraceae bacterium]
MPMICSSVNFFKLHDVTQAFGKMSSLLLAIVISLGMLGTSAVAKETVLTADFVEENGPYTQMRLSDGNIVKGQVIPLELANDRAVRFMLDVKLSVTVPQGCSLISADPIEVLSGSSEEAVTSDGVAYRRVFGGSAGELYSSLGLSYVSEPVQAASPPSSWAEDSVGQMNALGLIPVALDGQYQQNITRAEFCALAVPLYEKVKGTIGNLASPFDDTSETNVLKMAALGVVNGIGNNKFNPNGEITRQESAVILTRLSEAVGQPLPNANPTFSDKGSIASWASESVGKVQASGIMSGTGNNNFSPLGKYTREQNIITILRIWDLTQSETPMQPADNIYESLKTYAEARGYTSNGLDNSAGVCKVTFSNENYDFTVTYTEGATTLSYAVQSLIYGTQVAHQNDIPLSDVLPRFDDYAVKPTPEQNPLDETTVSEYVALKAYAESLGWTVDSYWTSVYDEYKNRYNLTLHNDSYNVNIFSFDGQISGKVRYCYFVENKTAEPIDWDNSVLCVLDEIKEVLIQYAGR